MKKYLKISLILISGLLILFFGSRVLIQKAIEHYLMIRRPERTDTLDLKEFQRISFHSRARTLYGSICTPGDSVPAVFICMGSGQVLADWQPFQLFLLEKGYASYVFTYTGFGNSTGVPSVKKLNEDVRAAWDEFIRLTPTATDRIAMSQSLGCGPLTQMIGEFEPPPSRYLLYAGFSSMREVLLEDERVPSFFIGLIPDSWNNNENIKKVSIPVLIAHSRTDEILSWQQAQAVSESAGENARLMLMEKYGHTDIFGHHSDSLWNRLFDFMSQH